MSYNATENSASRRIATLLDEGSFVEIGGAVTARSTTFNLQEKAAPSDGVITGLHRSKAPESELLPPAQRSSKNWCASVTCT